MLKRILALLVCVLLLFPTIVMADPPTGTPLSGSVTLSGKFDEHIQYDIREDATVILKNVQMGDGLYIAIAGELDNTMPEEMPTVTILLYGQNTIGSGDNRDVAMSFRGVNAVIESGEPDASLTVQGDYVDVGEITISERIGRGAIRISNTTSQNPVLTINADNVTVKAGTAGMSNAGLPITDCSPAILSFASDGGYGEVVLNGDNIRIMGGNRYAVHGGPFFPPCVGMLVGRLTISGRNVYISGGTNVGKSAPAVVADEVILVGSAAKPLAAEAGNKTMTTLKGSPFTAEKDVTAQVAGKQHVRTLSKALPATGDGADLALWLGLMALAAVAAVLLHRKQRI